MVHINKDWLRLDNQFCRFRNYDLTYALYAKFPSWGLRNLDSSTHGYNSDQIVDSLQHWLHNLFSNTIIIPQNTCDQIVPRVYKIKSELTWVTQNYNCLLAPQNDLGNLKTASGPIMVKQSNHGGDYKTDIYCVDSLVKILFVMLLHFIMGSYHSDFSSIHLSYVVVWGDLRFHMFLRCPKYYSKRCFSSFTFHSCSVHFIWWRDKISWCSFYPVGLPMHTD